MTAVFVDGTVGTAGCTSIQLHKCCDKFFLQLFVRRTIETSRFAKTIDGSSLVEASQIRSFVMHMDGPDMALSSLRNRKNATHRSDNDATAVEPDDLQRGPERASEFMSPFEMTNDQRLMSDLAGLSTLQLPRRCRWARTHPPDGRTPSALQEVIRAIPTRN